MLIREKPYQSGEKRHAQGAREVGSIFLVWRLNKRKTSLHYSNPLHPLCLLNPSSRSHVTLHFTLSFHHHLSFLVVATYLSLPIATLHLLNLHFDGDVVTLDLLRLHHMCSM